MDREGLRVRDGDTEACAWDNAKHVNNPKKHI